MVPDGSPLLCDKICSPAPVAQWTERRPPEPKSTVRVCAGVSKFDKTSQNSENVEEFVAALRFEQRGKLDLVPINNIKSHRTVYTIELTAKVILGAGLSLTDMLFYGHQIYMHTQPI